MQRAFVEESRVEEHLYKKLLPETGTEESRA
jgi:hypothetical protein